jgi:signal transduction histidine kinase
MQSTKPTSDDDENARKARLLLALLRVMTALGVCAGIISLFDSRNDVAITAVFYGAIVLALLGFSRLAKGGRLILAAWCTSLFFWLLIAIVTLLFGGLQGQNASTFAGSVLLIGVLVGGRAAIALAIASSGWCALVAVLEARGMLLQPLTPYSPLNAWTSVTVTIVLTSILLKVGLDSLQRMRLREQAAAVERDAALRRSIHAQKMEVVGTLAAGIAHDFNNLLTVIGSAAALLRQGVSARSDAAAALDDLDAATSRATMMTRQLVGFGRAPAARLVPVDLGALVTAQQSMLRRLLGSSIAVDTVAEPGAVVMADPAGLEQVVLNLAVNAREAMPRGGRLSMRVERDRDGMIVLRVVDAGGGMDDATRDRIFEPFFTTKRSGTGLGLATVHDHVSRFQGTIEVCSELGHGTTFTLQFPAAPGVALPADAADAAPATSGARRAGAEGGPRILLVEDDVAVRRATARVLERAGYDVTAVADGEEALAVAGAAPDLACVVSDVAMPRMDGAALGRALTQLHPELPVLLMSGEAAPSTLAIEGPKRVFLPKPFDAAELTAAVARLLR